jgi:hypothetical protein
VCGHERERSPMKWFIYLLLAVIVVGLGVTLTRKRSSSA